MRIRLLPFFIVTFFLNANSFGSEMVFPSGRTYPTFKTLESTLTDPAKVQRFGSCHVYAATAAAEAACFRHTNVRFRLSEAYLFYRHVRTQIDNPQSNFFLSILKDNFFSTNDGGDSATTLRRIINGSVMLEREYRMSDFETFIKEPLKIRDEYWRQRETGQNPDTQTFEKNLRYGLAKNLDILVNGLTTDSLETRVGLSRNIFKNPDHPLNSCEFNEMNTINFNVTIERAVALIANGIPFICSGNVTEGMHAVLFAGYKYDESSYDNVTFYARDSRYSEQLLSGYMQRCIRGLVAFYPSERHIVEYATSLQ